MIITDEDKEFLDGWRFALTTDVCYRFDCDGNCDACPIQEIRIAQEALFDAIAKVRSSKKEG